LNFFYIEVWNNSNEKVAREILAADFRFRGSLGPEKRGQDGFIEYMWSVNQALGNYVCMIEELVASQDRTAARMIFKGTHRAEFFGVGATNREIQWAGAAFFQINGGLIVELWVLGDVDSVKAQLGADLATGFSAC
jgi:steroid delta-isomerase-like uncharacterized protein